MATYSVVMPVYNAARTLERALTGIAALDPKPAAIYVVDDASTDGSAAIARRFPGVTVLPLTQNGGPGRARNVGVQHADSELLLMLDSDCYIDAAGFRQAHEHIASTPQLAGIMGVPLRETAPGPFAGVFKNYWYHLEFEAWGNPPRTLYGSCFLMRRQAYLAVDGFDESFGRTPCEDAEFYFRLVRAGFCFERDMRFTFVHDKRMTAWQLARTSFERSASIIRNLRGKLGQSGKPWSAAEQIRWVIEIGSGTGAVLGAPIALFALLGLISSGTRGGGASVLSLVVALWLLAPVALFFSIRDKLAVAYRDKGVAFAAKAFLCRMVEMPAAAMGIVWGSLPRRAKSDAGWASSMTAPDTDKGAR